MRKILLISLCLTLAACSSHRLSKGRAFQLTPVDYSALNGWRQDSVISALPAMKKSCATNPKGYEKLCGGISSVHSESDLRTLIEGTLQPYLVTSSGSKTGKITGYYEAELTGTRHHENGAQLPIYGAPAGYKQGKTYATRKSIENNGLNDAKIIAWADNPVDLFIMHVQGSGRLVTPEGEILQLGYAGNNGRTFKGLGAIMKEAGVYPSIANSMSKIREWCLDHPDKARTLMQKNDRYIFFKELAGEGPIGSAGVALTPARSLAVDTNYIPMHTPMWLETTNPNGGTIRQLMMAQDTGAAIKGGIRADFFWGYGAAAFQTAGHMNQQGSYYLLLPK
ncbi:MAG: MltA domain-containing protein [Alphaproteobacteria bacterium]|nr:MltA domain-containing protein [Alphaproteobacteria bacterium]